MFVLIISFFSQTIWLERLMVVDFNPAKSLPLLGCLRVCRCHLELPWRIPNLACSKGRRRLGHVCHMQSFWSCILLYLSLQQCCDEGH